MYRWLTQRFGRAPFSTRGSRKPKRSSERSLHFEPLETRALLSVTLDLGGAQTLIPGDNLNVSNDSDSEDDPKNPGQLRILERYQSEMTLDVNPTNPLNLAGFSHRIVVEWDDSVDPSQRIFTMNEIDVFHSQDGGATWATTRIDGSDDGLGDGKRFDPSLAFDAQGRLFVAYGHKNSQDTRLIVARSDNGGADFVRFDEVDKQDTLGNELEGLRPGVDKWHLATGPAPVPAENPQDPDIVVEAVYVAYCQFGYEDGSSDQRVVVAGWHEGEAEFTPPEVINDASIAGTSGAEGFADPAVGPDGELYVSWHDVNDGRLRLDVDLDGLWKEDDGFGTDKPTVQLNASMLGAGADGGGMPAYVRAPAQYGRGITNGPVLDVDRNTGRLYIAYADTKTTEELPVNDPSPDPKPILDSDIFLVYSDDHGLSWTPIAVSDTPDPSIDFLPWVDVDQTTGTVNVVYYTTEGDPQLVTGAPDEDWEFDDVHVQVASLRDDGQGNFSINRANLTTAMSNAGESTLGGDFLEYIGLAVHDGTIHGLWSDNRMIGTPPEYNTDLEAYTASAAFSSSTGENKLTIEGTATDDTIVFGFSADNDRFLEVTVNGETQFAGLAATVDQINVDGTQGDDTITTTGFESHLRVQEPDHELGKIEVTGNLTIDAESIIRFKPYGGADSFVKENAYTIVTADSITGTFSSSSGLGDYVDAETGGLSYSDTEVSVTMDYGLHPGDANLDTITDVRDFMIWNNNKFNSGTEWVEGDFDDNVVTDVRDFMIWNLHKFTSVPQEGAAAGGGG